MYISNSLGMGNSNSHSRKSKYVSHSQHAVVVPTTTVVQPTYAVQQTAYVQQQQQPQQTAYSPQPYQGLAPPSQQAVQQQPMVQQGLAPPLQQYQQPAPVQGLAPPPQQPMVQQGLAPPPQQYQQSVQQPAAPVQQQQQPIPDAFAYYFQKYQISPYYRNDLMTLSQFDIIMVLDDSGSMGTATDVGTRWGELKQMAAAVIDLGVLLDSDGIDVMFLNRGVRRGVRSMNDVHDLFSRPPSGCTPLSKRVREAMNLPRQNPQKPILLLIATDGVPDTGERYGHPDYDSVDIFRYVLEKERDPTKVFVSIIKCSDRDNETGYLDRMDRELLNLDVIDDYASERNEVLAKQPRGFVYSPGDNIARFLLGSVYPKYDNMDEKFVEY
jgi:hypothetical protein